MKPFKIQHLYLLLCVFGFLLPYSQIIPLILEGNMSVQLMIEQLFANRVSTLFAFDLLVTATVFIVFAVHEGRKLNIRHLWLPFLTTILVGASFGFPLFLYLRERTFEKNPT